MPAFRSFCFLACLASGFVSSASAAGSTGQRVTAAVVEVSDPAATFTFAESPNAAADVVESFQVASGGGQRAAAEPLVVSAVPEPTSYALMLAGLVALHWVARRRISRPD